MIGIARRQDKAKEIAFFDWHAAAQDYGAFTPASNQRLIDAFVRLTGFPRGARVADLGCGSGVFSALLHRAGYKVTGADLSPAMIERARQISGNYLQGRRCRASAVRFREL
jgi:2-polyprenyl-3-methyl-5-hydroxy-6-metoxy-1,4-benzoquinol methylase